MSTAQEAQARSFDCCDYARQCTVKKIELFKTQRLLAARIQMPRILAGDEYVQLAAYYREQMKHALPETAHLDVQLVPVYDGYSLAEITSEPEVLWQLLGVENFHIFLKIDEVSEEGAVRIRCSNRIAYQSRINTKAFTSDCERLLAQMCQKNVKVETCFKEDETLAPVPDD